MEDIIGAINTIIKEHRVLTSNALDLDKIANDTEAMGVLEKGKDTFMPGRFDENRSLQKLEQMHAKFEAGLKSHFDFEETRLTAALKDSGKVEAVKALDGLLLEHKFLLERIEHQKKQIAELRSGKVSAGVWGAQGHDLRAFITQTNKMISAHALSEHNLLNKLLDKYSPADK
jgi:hypothetical protein